MIPPRACPPPSSATDAAFLRAIHADRMGPLVQRHLATTGTVRELVADYVRWKDQDGSLVGYRADVEQAGSVVSTYVTVRTAPVPRLADEAERLRHRAEEDHAGLRAFAFVPEESVLLLAFPIDRAMHDLRRLVRPSKVRTLVAQCCPSLVPADHRFSKSRSSVQLASYRPERRAVLHWRIGVVGPDGRAGAQPSLWIRCHAESQTQRTRSATDAALAAGLRVPPTLGVAHDRLMFEGHVDGRPWSPAPDAPHDIEAAAHVVARLHAVPPPRTLPTHHALAELDLVLAAVDDLVRLDPRLGAVGRQLADRLAHDVPPAAPAVLAHGDLHPGQVLLAEQGAGLVDFDRACRAPAAHDLATLIAQCADRDRVFGMASGRAFVSAYGRRAPLPAPTTLAWWTACALVRNATRPFRRLHPEWRTLAASLLQLAERTVLGADPEVAWS